MAMREKKDYALLWVNGMKFADLYDLMKADIELEISLQQMREGDTTPALTPEEIAWAETVTLDDERPEW